MTSLPKLDILLPQSRLITPTRKYELDWLRVLAILGFSIQRLRYPKPFLAHANEAVLPFYILYQTVLLTLGYFIMRRPLADLLKWTITAALSFIICIGLYELLIRRINPLRFLFGLRPRVKKKFAATA